ncbi:hypothetical protein ACFPOB_26100 [Bosea eneae]|uniref:Beta sliding clamp n=1 Tax=Bosea eneae TaxID=151454 RepID=A0ABW0IZK4_9HYPH
MDFVTVEGRALKSVMAALLSAADLRCKIPALACVKLSLSEAGLTLEATNLDLAVTARLDVIDGYGEWTMLLPVHQLEAIARVAGPMPMRIERGAPASIVLGDGEARYTLEALPAADFPQFPVEAGELVERFTNGMLPGLLAKVAPFVSYEETRYYLNGVYWHRGAHGACLVATDGHRLGRCNYTREPCADLKAIIPRDAINLISRHLQRCDISVHASKKPGQGLVFASEGLTIATKLIDGVYPDYERVVPSEGTFVLALKRPDILAGVARIAALGREKFWSIKFEAQDGRCAITRKIDAGAVIVPLSTDWPTQDGKAMAPFGLNGSCLAEMAHDCEGDIALGLTDPSAPILIRDQDPSMTRVLMPRRV